MVLLLRLANQLDLHSAFHLVEVDALSPCLFRMAKPKHRSAIALVSQSDLAEPLRPVCLYVCRAQMVWLIPPERPEIRQPAAIQPVMHRSLPLLAVEYSLDSPF